jgi:ORF6N domain
VQIQIAECARAIPILRGQKALLDTELAELYGVTTKALLQAVKRNAKRFPEDFMFQLTVGECNALRSQIVTSRGQHGGATALSPSQRCTGISI